MIRAAIAGLALVGSIARAETWLYRVALDPAAPLAAQISVDLPAARREQEFSVQVRGMAINVMPQVLDVRCDGTPVAPDSARAWRVQGWYCGRLSWRVPLAALGATGVDVRAQPSLFAAREGLWVIAEASALLRPVGDAQHDGEVEFVGGGGAVHSGEQGSGPQRPRVPTLAQPPEFYAVGAGPVSIVREGDADLIYVNLLGVPLRDLFGQHRRQLGYLMRTAGVRPPKLFRTAVIWLPSAVDDGPQVVAGHRTVLAGAALHDGRLQGAEATLLALLHEQFQQFAPESLPLWARESLAQYYAVKALRRTRLPAEAVAAAERRALDPLRAPTLTLREAQRRVLAGEVGAMASLHVDGATFWDRVDRAIVRKSGFRTLDSMLPRLLTADWRNDGLPPAVEERLRRYAGDAAIDELLQRYVGE